MKILVADDDPDLCAAVRSVLSKAGHRVIVSRDGRSALEQTLRSAPDLLLLDAEMPEMSGWELMRHLRADPMLQHLPVLFLTGKTRIQDKVAGLELGADDYITKPFDSRELVARVQGLIRRMRLELEANPLSLLPGNRAIEAEIESRIRADAKFAVLYADINGFKAFNDRYGFSQGDRVIQTTARILLDARRPGDFVGHVGGDDFIAVTTPRRAVPTCRRVIAEFDAFARTLYSREDLANGYIEVPDRQGRMGRFLIMGIAIGVVTNERRRIESVGEVSEIGTELKKSAKRSPGSAYFVDRRG